MKIFIILGLTLMPFTALAQDHSATFVDPSGKEMGMATLQATKNGVLVDAEVKGLPPSTWVAFHVHEMGDCAPMTKLDSAGGHFNPDGHDHGYLSENGPHAGDMPNIWVDANGEARAQVFNPMVTLDKGERGIEARALMIHAKPDDYKSQPAGAAGDRLACAVIK